MSNLAEYLKEKTTINNTFLTDVLEGLSQDQKSLSCKYFYDDEGSRLFEKICLLDEYYVTRSEMAILQSAKSDIAQCLGADLTIIEPGAGAAQKVRILLDELERPQAFIALEISSDALENSANEMRARFPNLDIKPMQGDFTNPYDLSRLPLTAQSDRRLVFFPGSTIGNFPAEGAVGVLSSLRTLAGDEGFVLIGVDLLKSRERLIAAYDDSQGVTAKFNKNILVRINRELSGNFDVEHGFQHRAIFNESLSRIEMHLMSTAEQTVSISGIDIEFSEGESIHTESSHKYTVDGFGALARDAGMAVLNHWSDEREDFALFLLRAS